MKVNSFALAKSALVICLTQGFSHAAVAQTVDELAAKFGARESI